MNRTYEDMSKEELITLVKRLAMQHDVWSERAKRMHTQAHELYHMIGINIIENLTPQELFDKAHFVHEPYRLPATTGKPLFGIR